MHWRLKRQLIAIGIVGLLAAMVAFALFFFFRVTPSSPSISIGPQEPLRLLWSRFFLVRPGVYDVAALLENPNDHARAIPLHYVFRLFDENDILIAAKEGSGFLNPSERFVIVEPLVAGAVRVPKRVSFEIRDVMWVAGEKLVLPLVVKQKHFETRPTESFGQASGTDTTVRVTLANIDVRSSAALEIVSVLADEEHNATAVAHAIVDPVSGGEEREVVFTWPARPSVGTGGPKALPEPETIQIYVREQ